HIMRSAAIIQILQPHFECEFWTKNPEYVPLIDFTHASLIVEFKHDDVVNEAHIISNCLASDDVILLLDGYKFNTEYQSIIKKAGINMVCIDDIMQYHFLADVIINHAGGINRQSYSCEPYTNIFLGPEYALVKPLFYSKARPERNLSEEKIFISLGAADPKNDTDKVLQKLIRLSRFEKIHIIIGAANQNFKELQLKYADHTSCIFHNNLSGPSIYRLMHSCSYAVLTPSTICYEYMSIGGIVYLYQIAENQRNIKEYFIQEKMAFYFEEINNISLREKQYSLEQQVHIFDHKSPERILKIFFDLAEKF
ncbi:MAG: hypothetical protein H0U27_11390, partial [Nitrosopumilus sp.]|nr:hypothetical protein [Nitrosopumilus sp.]